MKTWIIPMLAFIFAMNTSAQKSPEWKALVAKSKFKDWPGFADDPAKEGCIGLQDHGYDCWYKNVKSGN